jgi:hypothetical protein
LPLEVILPDPVINQLRAQPGLLARGQVIGVEVNLSAGTLPLALPPTQEAPVATPATTRLITGQNQGPSTAPAPPLPDFFPTGSPGALVQKLSGLALPLAERATADASTPPARPASAPIVTPKHTPGLGALPPPVLDAALRASFRQLPIGPAIAALLGEPSAEIDPTLQTALRGLRLDAHAPAQPAKLQQIVAQSGLFTEARIAASLTQPPAFRSPPVLPPPVERVETIKPAEPARSEAAQTPKQPAASQQPPATNSQTAAASSFVKQSPDLKSLLLRALQSLSPLASASPDSQPDSAPKAERPASPASTADTTRNTPREALNLAPRAHAPNGAPELARLVEGAIERIKLHQIASLPDHPHLTVTDERVQSVRFAMQLPLAIHGPENPETTMIGLLIERETRPDAANLVIEDRDAQTEVEAAPWKVRIAVDLEETGPVQAEIALRGPRVAVTLWAERRATAEMARASIGQLHQALSAQNFDVGMLDIRDGRPHGAMPRHLPSLDRRS